jgi:hypothetical protein
VTVSAGCSAWVMRNSPPLTYKAPAPRAGSRTWHPTCSAHPPPPLPHRHAPHRQPRTVGAKRRPRNLQTARNDSSDVSITAPGIEVHLDCDQLKHQPPSQPIGSREKGQNKLQRRCFAPAAPREHPKFICGTGRGSTNGRGGKGRTRTGDPVDHIHYEGFCLLIDGLKYVSFHCYPERGFNSP